MPSSVPSFRASAVRDKSSGGGGDANSPSQCDHIRGLQGYPYEALLGTAVGALGPVPEVQVAESARPVRASEETDHAVLRGAFGAWRGDHGSLPLGVFNGWLDQACPAGQQFGHHGLLDGVGLVAAGLEGVDLVVHVCEDGGDGALFVEGREVQLEVLNHALV